MAEAVATPIQNQVPLDPAPGFNPWGEGQGPVGPGGPQGAPPVGPGGHPIGSTFQDDYGHYVTVQPDGSVAPYHTPTGNQTAGASAANIPGLIFIDDGRGGGRYIHQDGTPATNAEVSQAITVSRNSNSTSFNTSQSISDPRALAIQQQQADEQKTRDDAATQQAIATLNETIRSHNADYANLQATLAFNQQKEAFAEQTSNTTLARQAQQDVFANTMSLNTLNLQRATLVNNRDSLQAQLQLQAATQNAQNALAANQQNQQAEQNRVTALQKNQEDTATFASNPQDAGKSAAFYLANRGWGQAADASGNVDLRSQESLQPLQGALNLNEVLSKPITPYVPQQVTAPTLAALDLSQIVNPTIPQAQTMTAQANGGGGEAAAQAVNNARYAAMFGAAADAARTGTTQGAAPASVANLGGGMGQANQAVGGATFNGAPIAGAFAAYKGGGLADSAYISGEDGPELNIPQADGHSTVILNQAEAKELMGLDLKKLAKMPQFKRGGVMRYADGGVFTSTDAPPPMLDTTGAVNFGNAAYQKGLQAVGIGNAPTPVYGSSPGFSPYVNQLFASLAATAGRGDAGVYTQQSQDLTPPGYRALPYGVAARPVTRTA